ncbi:quinohemoprotein amine dehydrogenase subunit alpha [Halarcobacter anaerophilus]|uniref:quinohemoprotein amine dehydrogenase subunit alpha n=1 Tax=Halarcobacter anaerophilus TaxID=877500 RepID=UPI000698A305|nr:quinohemoprotein amine dehydrogenase subunit alpha [Halarcobacter anaerophilus]
MKTTYLNSVLKLGIGLLVSSASLYAMQFENAKNIIDTKCTACHSGNLDSGLSRISEQRKSPEGWFMTISRMENSHGLVLSDVEKRSVVKYLADTQGLNPDETESYRYVLEKTPNYQEKHENQFLTEMCARCHSEARFSLQRRTTQEWNNLIEFHLGQFPTLEYQALSRDRDWFSIAKDEIVPLLSKSFGNDTNFEKIDANYEGTWSLYGHKLGDGDFSATMSAKKVSNDVYKLTLKGNYLDGREFNATGEAVVYSGYEWRATLDLDGIAFNQVFKMNPKSQELKGSMFETLHSEEYSYIKGVKSSNTKSVVLGVYPKSIKAGESEVITISGNNLDGKVKLSSGLKINTILEKTASKIVLDVTASSKYDSKQVDLSVGSIKLDKELTVYKKIDVLKVFPSYAIARVGDGGGVMPKQHAIFEAIGYLAGNDGKLGTNDDISLGKVDAKWSVAPFDKRAKEDQDIKFAGTMDSFSGRFTPSFAGPNPLRRFGTNNAGNLKVIATYKDNNETLKADSHLMVTVQKWVNSPIN